MPAHQGEPKTLQFQPGKPLSLRSSSSTNFPEVKNQCIPRKSSLNKPSASLSSGDSRELLQNLRKKGRGNRGGKGGRKRGKFRANSCSYFKKTKASHRSQEGIPRCQQAGKFTTCFPRFQHSHEEIINGGTAGALWKRQILGM